MNNKAVFHLKCYPLSCKIVTIAQERTRCNTESHIRTALHYIDGGNYSVIDVMSGMKFLPLCQLMG